MEELNLKELLNYYIKKLPIIILTTILVILLSYGYVKYIQTPMYHSKTTIILVQNSNESIDNTLTQSELNVNEKLVKTYSEIIKSRTILEKVIESLQLQMSSKELENEIDVKLISDTSILEVTVSNEDNELAAIIANKLAEIFKEEITKIYNLENVSIIDKAIIEENPYNINLIKTIVICSFLEIGFVCIIIFIVYYFDDTIKSSKEIETKLKLPLLGEVASVNKLLKEEDKLLKKKQTKKNKTKPNKVANKKRKGKKNERINSK